MQNFTKTLNNLIRRQQALPFFERKRGREMTLSSLVRCGCIQTKRWLLCKPVPLSQILFTMSYWISPLHFNNSSSTMRTQFLGCYPYRHLTLTTSYVSDRFFFCWRATSFWAMIICQTWKIRTGRSLSCEAATPRYWWQQPRKNCLCRRNVNVFAVSAWICFLRMHCTFLQLCRPRLPCTPMGTSPCHKVENYNLSGNTCHSRAVWVV